MRTSVRDTVAISSWVPHLLLVGAVLAAVLAGPGASAAEDSATATPAVQGYRGVDGPQSYQGAFRDLVAEIDDFWATTFADAGVPYVSPENVIVDRRLETDCGPIEPEPNAFYCPFDQTIYLVPQFLVDRESQVGDYAPIAILAHEWGHHVQALLGIQTATTKPMELQADCLLGVFTAYADDIGLLDYGDFLEALTSALDVGDPLGLPEDTPGAHGAPEERVKAVSRGFGGGPVSGCGMPLAAESAAPVSLPDPPVAEPPPAAAESAARPLDAAALLPARLPLAQADCFRVDGDGVFSFEALVARFSDTADAAARLGALGWHEGAYRQFGCDTPPPGSAGWIEVNTHVFADAAAAREAVGFFAATRAAGTALRTLPGRPLGDESLGLIGPASNGTEFTLYLSRGSVLLRTTGVSPSGEPIDDVVAVAEALIAAIDTGGPSQSTAGLSSPSQPANASVWSLLPEFPPLSYGSCFTIQGSGAYPLADVDAFLREAASGTESAVLAWQDGAYIDFRCAAPPVGGASYLGVVMHRFAFPAEAQQAVTYWEAGYVPTASEAYVCDSSGPIMACVTASGSDGIPFQDALDVLAGVLATAG